jgi:hypothetical protein
MAEMNDAKSVSKPCCTIGIVVIANHLICVELNALHRQSVSAFEQLFVIPDKSDISNC